MAEPYYFPRSPAFNTGVLPISTDNSHSRSKGSRRSPPSVASPMAMSIPNSRNDDEPPPPLPPPRFVPIDGPTAYEVPPSFDPRSRDHDHDFFSEDRESYRESYKSRDRSYRPDLDEGYHSIGSSARLVHPPCVVICYSVELHLDLRTTAR